MILKTKISAGIAAFSALLTLSCPSAAVSEVHDGFYMLDRLNRASLVMLSEQGIVDKDKTILIADALAKLYQAGNDKGFKRTTTYSSIEPFLVESAGPEVTRLHTARSTWDVGAVNRRMLQRIGTASIRSAYPSTRVASEFCG